MIYKKIEIYNAAEIVSENNAVGWLRVPQYVKERLETDAAKELCSNSTGVELRFVMKSNKAIIKMKAISEKGYLNTFHIFHGAMQGCWQEHEINKFIGSELCEFEIAYPKIWKR